jgi:hypothetical protein
MLQQGASIRQIAAEIGVDHSTVSREIKKRRLPSNKTYGIYIINECKLRQSCTVENLCFRNTRQGELPSSMCKHKCSACRVISCNSFCEKFIPETCDRLINSPGVCNGCNLEQNVHYLNIITFQKKPINNIKQLLVIQEKEHT